MSSTRPEADRLEHKRLRARERMRVRRKFDPDASREVMRRFRERHPNYARDTMRRLRAENPEKYREADRRRRLKDPTHQKNLWTNYRPERYQELLDAQAGLCAVCRQPETKRHPQTGQVQRLAVDHDHACCPGKKSCGACVRGLLCERCNLSDDPALFRSYADYLERRTPA